MIFGLLVTIATCAAVWCLTGPSHQRVFGALFGLADSILWLFAGVSAGKVAVVIVAAFCAFSFARPLVRSRLSRIFRRHHAH